MTKDEALQLALDSMKEIIHWYAVRDRNDVFLNFVDQNPEIQKTMKSITAIKEALETKDEPVQVSPFEFVEIVYEKECLIGRPIVWAQWPNEEKNT